MCSAKEILKQASVHTVEWLLLTAFIQVYNKNGQKDGFCFYCF